MKALILALLSVASIAQAKEMVMNPVESARTFSEISKTARVIEKGVFRTRIAQGDVICTRDLIVKAESAMPYRYWCTYFVEDTYAPAHAETSARSNSGRVQ